MCKMPKVDTTPPPIIAAPDNRDATRQSDAEMRRRRARSGAAANILTSPVGIPATAQLGAPA